MIRRKRAVPARTRALVRALAGLLAVLVVTVHFAAVSHMAFVAHAICAEHGTLVHVETRAPAALPQHGDEGRAPQAAPADGSASEQHDHCIVGVTQPGEGQVARAAVSVVHEEPRPAAVPLPAPLAAPVVSVPPPPIALLLLSPKSSPPV